LVKAGIIDPTKVVRSALENAASAAIMFLTVETVIADTPSKENDSSANQGQAGAMPMM
jgi:chaperonin GroEL